MLFWPPHDSVVRKKQYLGRSSSETRGRPIHNWSGASLERRRLAETRRMSGERRLRTRDVRKRRIWSADMEEK